MLGKLLGVMEGFLASWRGPAPRDGDVIEIDGEVRVALGSTRDTIWVYPRDKVEAIGPPTMRFASDAPERYMHRVDR
jgi:hypothetical protein